MDLFLKKPLKSIVTSSTKHPLIPYGVDYSKDKTGIPKKFHADEYWSDLVVPSIDQGGCGSCWAFATSSCLTERFNILVSKRILSDCLSPNLLIACNRAIEFQYQRKKFEKNTAKHVQIGNDILNRYGCHGNSIIYTCFFLSVIGSIRYQCSPYIGDMTDEEYIYDRTNLGYRSPFINNVNTYNNIFGQDTCSTYMGNLGINLNVMSCYGHYIFNDQIYTEPAQLFRNLFYYFIKDCVSHPEYIQQDILKWGPISTSFTVYLDFYSFNPITDGVYTHSDPSSPIVGGHSVTISGWGDYYDEKTGKWVPYWWIKNSWGVKWGYDGYFRMLRGSNLCGIEENIVGMMPNIFPQNPDDITTFMDILMTRYNFYKNVQDEYIRLFINALNGFSLIEDKLFDKIITKSRVREYPIVDYFYFHIKYPSSFLLDPRDGYTRYSHFAFPGLSFKAPFRARDVIQKL